MPKQISPNAEHRIPVNDHELFARLRDYAMRHNFTWIEALDTMLQAAEREEAAIVIEEPA